MNQTLPTAEEQLRFLQNLQRLLDEGVFVSTYKFALLLALADLAVEKGNVGAAPLRLTVWEIAEKFVGYYWRQVIEYPGSIGGKEYLQPGGHFYFATDFEDYGLDVAALMAGRIDFGNIFAPDLYRFAVDKYHLSKYMLKFMQEGKPIRFVHYRKIS